MSIAIAYRIFSGIGPAGHLKDVGIPVLQDLPVGENLVSAD